MDPADEDRPDSRTPGLVGRGRDDIDFARILGFSDNVIAFALTLVAAGVVVSIATRDPSADVKELWRDGGVELATFLLVGVLWLRHFQVTHALRAFDRPLIRANLAFLGCIATAPVTVRLALEFESGGTFALFALTLAAATALLAYMTLHARAAGMVVAGTWITSPRLSPALLMAPTAVLLCGVPLGFVSPEAGALAVLGGALASGLWHRRTRRGPDPG